MASKLESGDTTGRFILVWVWEEFKFDVLYSLSVRFGLDVRHPFHLGKKPLIKRGG